MSPRPDLDFDRSAIGRQGSRYEIATPALILDLDAVEANIAAMADFAARSGIGLRPHTKTHKSIELARRQLAAGAVGVCVARLGEAEALIAGGIEDVLITAPLATIPAYQRFAQLAQVAPKLKIVMDHPDGARDLNQALAALGPNPPQIDVLIDLDPGLHRTGIAPDAKALALAEEIAAQPQLNLVGVQAYAGHLMHIEDAEKRQARYRAAMAPIAAIVAELRAAGHNLSIVTGGGTGSFAIDADIGLFSDIQVGSYLFMDVEYIAVQPSHSDQWPFKPALFVQSAVISANHETLVTLDAGYKALATDGPAPKVAEGPWAQARFVFMGDEQGAMISSGDQALPPRGAIVSLTAPHCDPTVNLYDVYHVVRQDRLIDIWPIDTRGRGR